MIKTIAAAVVASVIAALAAACSGSPDELLPQRFPPGVDAGKDLGQLPPWWTDAGDN